MNLEIVTASEGETLDLGRRMAGMLQGGDVLCVDGELGAGKTCFVRGIATGLGISELEVSSPTFSIAHVHGYPGGTLYHIDAYRLSGVEELETIGWDEMVADDRGVVVCEWAERIADAMPAQRIEVELHHRSPSERGVVLTIPEGMSSRFTSLR
ncbi:MAG: tRNA (adenosine(37)-N6)-threonylcarbamoyltransferase complex ATPase subunit type 1 TsaE [Phycisphaerae bacterium]|nr:tRNA (adenosine(37)-N6)-threonylcarbamoyltransferase complex ATPase subunit type 1 TsaE [Phycisphaerae bacterium]